MLTVSICTVLLPSWSLADLKQLNMFWHTCLHHELKFN
jgi:hypothetical protein